MYELTLQVAESEANIMIQGESGTGKELIARAIHYNSPRRGRRFLSINCAALSDSLLESQLFGHIRGAFTGAVTTQKGLLEEAGGGTLFLDEIGDISPALQVKLLRVIQERDFLPVGSTRSKSVDIRFVAATNKNLEREVKEGRFREDLFLPAERHQHHASAAAGTKGGCGAARPVPAQKIRPSTGKELTGITAGALRLLADYSWPGNVRELENVIERAVILARGTEITEDLLPIRRESLAPSGLLPGEGDDFPGKCRARPDLEDPARRPTSTRPARRSYSALPARPWTGRSSNMPSTCHNSSPKRIERERPCLSCASPSGPS